jgi:acetyl-CoA acetyltransferase
VIRTGLRADELPRLARIRIIAVAEVPPPIMGIGPVPASAKALVRAGLGLEDVELIEVNEALARPGAGGARPVGPGRGRRAHQRQRRAIALGHPLGRSGARLITTLVHDRARRDAQVALATRCIGVGQGIAMVLDRGEDR